MRIIAGRFRGKRLASFSGQYPAHHRPGPRDPVQRRSRPGPGFRLARPVLGIGSRGNRGPQPGRPARHLQRPVSRIHGAAPQEPGPLPGGGGIRDSPEGFIHPPEEPPASRRRLRLSGPALQVQTPCQASGEALGHALDPSGERHRPGGLQEDSASGNDPPDRMDPYRSGRRQQAALLRVAGRAAGTGQRTAG